MNKFNKAVSLFESEDDWGPEQTKTISIEEFAEAVAELIKSGGNSRTGDLMIKQFAKLFVQYDEVREFGDFMSYNARKGELVFDDAD